MERLTNSLFSVAIAGGGGVLASMGLAATNLDPQSITIASLGAIIALLAKQDARIFSLETRMSNYEKRGRK